MIAAAGTPEPSAPPLLWLLLCLPALLAILWSFRHLPRFLAHEGEAP
jgi:hypothetical protein